MVGLITLNSKMQYNYGCLLQSYALQTYLNQMHIPAEAVFCPCESAVKACKSWIYTSMHLEIHKKSRTIRILGSTERKHNEQCLAFIHGITQPRCYAWFNRHMRRDVAARYDKLIVGSDQVWNPYWGIHGKYRELYSLGFVSPEKRFSYAASFGVENIPREKQMLYTDLLKAFRMLSVREDAGKRIVEELTGRTDVQVLVDPTLLLTRKQWDAVAEKPEQKLPKKYLLTYFLGTVSAERRQAIEDKAAETGCEILWLMDRDCPFYAIGPQHFLYLIQNAHMVCTDSFHGSVFSFLYEKPLVIFEREDSLENMGSRIRTLADKFSLTHCIAKGNRMPDTGWADYTTGFAVLEAEREKSKLFLLQVFQET